MRRRAYSVHRKANFRNTAAFIVLATLIAPGVVLAQTTPGNDYRNPERQYVDAQGMSIEEGIMVRDITPMTIGDPGTGGLAWSYHGHGNAFVGDYAGSVGPGIWPTETVVTVGETSVPFENGTSYTNGAGTSATLSGSSGNYVYTSPDGTIYTFTSYLLSSILKPNGMKITVYGGSVVTNTGYALKFDSSTGRISAVNMLAHSCDTQAVSCDTYDNYVTFGGYSDPAITGPGGRYQVTDSLGNYWRWRWMFSYVIPGHTPEDKERGPGVIWAYKDPTGILQTANYDNNGGSLLSYTDPRGTYTYGSPVKDPSGAALYSTSCSTGAIICIGDALGNNTSYTIASFITATIPDNGYPLGQYTRVTQVTKPEGNSLSYTYNARGNVTQTVSNPKPGSSLSAITVYQAGYDTTCANPKTCNQPNWTKDAKGNQTDYTYDATHGGALTVTLPADNNGLRRRTYNTYTPFDTGNGNIYRLTRSETCALNAGQLSLGACPATADTSVAVTSYGTSTTAPKTYKSFQPYQVTQTDGASSLSVTTTYTYDNVGNVIVVDGPRTDVDDRVYKTYDVNRRVIFEIGVLPGGNGSPKRTVTRHWYDAAGKEWKTEVGYANTNATDGSDFVVTAFTRITFDSAGRAIKTEQVQP